MKITLGNLLLCIAIISLVGAGSWLMFDEKAPDPDLEFHIGSEVYLIIGGRGQVIKISGDQYLIRIWDSQGGIDGYWFHEWELEAPIIDRFNPGSTSPAIPLTKQDILDWNAP